MLHTGFNLSGHPHPLQLYSLEKKKEKKKAAQFMASIFLIEKEMHASNQKFNADLTVWMLPERRINEQ